MDVLTTVYDIFVYASAVGLTAKQKLVITVGP
jgi:hypothetical protein